MAVESLGVAFVHVERDLAGSVIYGGVIWVLSYVLSQLPMGVVYAVWSGMGIAR